MKTLTFTFFILSLFTGTAIAQTIEGNIKDAQTGKTLPFVNIGIIGKAWGTVSNDDGRFSLTVDRAIGTDSLKISIIGYQPKKILIADLKKNPENFRAITLEPAVTKLKEVRVLNRKLRGGSLGNEVPESNLGVGFTNNTLGYELAALIRIKKTPTLIKHFYANIYSYRRAEATVKLRLNFYSVKNGLPDKLLNDQNIFFTVNKGDKKISVDLKPYQVYTDEDFFASLEYIQSVPGRGLMFGATSGPLGQNIFRPTSQADWVQIAGAQVGFYVDVDH